MDQFLKIKRLNLNRSSIQSLLKDTLPLLDGHSGRQKFVWFEQPTGLGLRMVGKKGGCSLAWVVQTRPRGESSPCRLTLKTPFICSAESIEAAREEALLLIDQARSGLNPADQRAKALLVTQLETAKSKILQEAGSRPLFDYYLEYIEANRIHWQARHLADHFAFAQAPGGDLKRRGKTRTGKKVAGPLYELLQLGPKSLTRRWVKEWIVRERQDRPTRLAGSIRVLRSFVRWMNESETYHGLIDPLVVQAREVSRLVPKTGVRTQTLEKGQLKAWVAAVMQLDSVLASRALLLLFLTGARMREVLTLRWENIDLLWNVMTIKDKAEGTRRVPITSMVRHLLMELKAINESKNVVRYRVGRIQRDPSPYVFFSERAECGHMTDISVAISKVAKASHIHGWSAHDLRRTYSGLAEWLDLPSGVIAQLQGHKPSATIERHYKPRSIDLLRMHAQRYEDWLVDNSGLSAFFTLFKSEEDLAASIQPQAA